MINEYLLSWDWIACHTVHGYSWIEKKNWFSAILFSVFETLTNFFVGHSLRHRPKLLIPKLKKVAPCWHLSKKFQILILDGITNVYWSYFTHQNASFVYASVQITLVKKIRNHFSGLSKTKGKALADLLFFSSLAMFFWQLSIFFEIAAPALSLFVSILLLRRSRPV